MEHENILYLIIISDLKLVSTKDKCIDKYMIIIKYIICKNPNIIFIKNKNLKSPIFLIFEDTNIITGPLNIINKIFSFKSIIYGSEFNLLYLTFFKNIIFILLYLKECYHININHYLQYNNLYPLKIMAINSKTDLFEFLIQYGANPFFKKENNLDTINMA